MGFQGVEGVARSRVVVVVMVVMMVVVEVEVGGRMWHWVCPFGHRRKRAALPGGDGMSALAAQTKKQSHTLATKKKVKGTVRGTGKETKHTGKEGTRDLAAQAGVC